jgi:hypothetical protein
VHNLLTDVFHIPICVGSIQACRRAGMQGSEAEPRPSFTLPRVPGISQVPGEPASGRRPIMLALSLVGAPAHRGAGGDSASVSGVGPGASISTKPIATALHPVPSQVCGRR